MRALLGRLYVVVLRSVFMLLRANTRCGQRLRGEAGGGERNSQSEAATAKHVAGAAYIHGQCIRDPGWLTVVSVVFFVSSRFFLRALCFVSVCRCVLPQGGHLPARLGPAQGEYILYLRARKWCIALHCIAFFFFFPIVHGGFAAQGGIMNNKPAGVGEAREEYTNAVESRQEGGFFCFLRP